MTEKENKERGQIDETEASKQGASPEELRDINEARGDGGNPQWWKDQGKDKDSDRK